MCSATQKRKKKRKTDCDEDRSDDTLSSSEENGDEEDTVIVDFIENELKFGNHDRLVGTGEEDLEFLDGLFDYLNFDDDGLVNEVDEVDEDGVEVKKSEMNDDDESWDIEDLFYVSTLGTGELVGTAHSSTSHPRWIRLFTEASSFHVPLRGDDLEHLIEGLHNVVRSFSPHKLQRSNPVTKYE